LNDIGKHTRSLAISLKALRETPVLQTTPEQIAKHIVAAGTEARYAEQAALNKATSDNVALSRGLSGYLNRAKTADSQFKWLCGVFTLGFIIGGLIIFALASLCWNDKQTVKSVVTEQSESPKKKKR
jgi:glycerol uptake facilitator-like aquaporin